MPRHLVTAALPYANGPVHIGHLAGCYIPSDIYVRYLRMKGEDVLYVCGSDEHGVPITLRARHEGVSPQVIVDRYHAMMKKAFADFGIAFDHYSRTTAPVHHKTASDFFLELYRKGVFTEEVTEQYYDDEVKQFLADRYIMGTCPRCGYEKAYGDQCEWCGSSLSPAELIDPRSTLSGRQPVLRQTRNWFLPLDRFQPDIEAYIESHKDDWKTNVYGQCRSWLNEGLRPRAMTRDLDWGIRVPLTGAEDKVLYVWFDAPIGYISSTIEYFADQPGRSHAWEDYWTEPDTKLVHFIGKDNIVFHCIIFPTMLMAHGGFILPENVPANEFLNLEGDKISTSRNWAVWLHEYLEDFPGREDELRFVLTAVAPESKDSEFTWKDYQARVNNELVAIFGNFVNRTMVLTHKYYGGIVPEPGDLSKTDHDLIHDIRNAKLKIGLLLDRFRFRDAQFEMMNLARAGNKYLADTEPWKIAGTDPERVKTVMYMALEATAWLAGLCQPFLPFTARRLFAMMGIAPLPWKALDGRILAPGLKLKRPRLLFEKLEDDVIDKQIEKLQANRPEDSGGGDTADGLTAFKPGTTFDDFSKMDLRIATILEAERVPRTDKLLKLLLDVGAEKRTVVSGIAEHYEPGAIIGRQVVYLANLAPRKIRGVESSGMVLLAENRDGELVFVSPEKAAGNGATVK